MSDEMNITCTCAVCGKSSKQTVLLSSITFGEPDLDGRPAEMMRSTMEWWIMECPHCGYIAEDLCKAPADAGYLSAERYTTADGIAFKSELARRFYRRGLLCAHEQKHQAAFTEALYAAWSCDDAGDSESAVLCRRAALEQMEQVATGDWDDPGEMHCQRMDLLRRTGRFEQVASEYSGMTFEDETPEKLRRFQLELARRQDTACHTMEECKKQAFKTEPPRKA